MAHASGTPAIEKLVGRSNYNSWKFAIQALLEHEDLWGCVAGDASYVADARKDTKARAKIILLVDPINYVHIQDTTTAKEAWEKLQSAFGDSGLTRKVGVLRILVTTQLDNCSSVEEYVNTVITTAHKLNGLNFEVKDEWIGTLLLAGLPDDYRPMIMGLESSGTTITSDSIKTKLLQDVIKGKSVKNGNTESAFWAKANKQKYNKDKVRCFSCNLFGHFASQCPTKKQDSSTNKMNKNKVENKGKYSAFFALYTSNATENINNEWYIDSCASSHMTADQKLLQDIEPCGNTQIVAADNVIMTAKSVGNVNLPVMSNNTMGEVTAREVLYIPKLKANLLSVSKIVNSGHTVSFSENGCTISTKENELIATASVTNGIYKLDSAKKEVAYIQQRSNGDLWHRRLGHLNRRAMMMLKNNLVTGYDLSDCSREQCIPCIKAKQHRSPFKRSGKRLQEILQLVHSDLCGPMETNSIGGAKYFFTLIDDHTRKIFVYFLEKKSEVAETFEEFKNLVENQTGKRIKCLRTDNGTEYVNRNVKNILTRAGIKHQLTVSYSPQQNGLAERTNRTIVERAKSMLIGAQLSTEYWAEAVSTAVYLINRSPTSATERTPENLWSGEKPDLSKIRVFGCKAMCHIPKEKRQKWDAKSKEMLFMGYCENTKGYRLIDPLTKKITISRDVIFLENEFLDKKEITETSPKDHNLQNADNISVVYKEDENEHDIEENSEGSSEVVLSKIEVETEVSDNTEDLMGDSNSDEIYVATKSSSHPGVRRTSRSTKPRVMDDYVTFLAEKHPSDPETLEDAMKSPNKQNWIEAIKADDDSLIKNDTWDFVDHPPEGRKILNTRWVFKTKRNSDGIVERYKARLVVKGCAQIKSIDYTETFSPVVRYSSIRFLFALAVKYDLIMHHMDVVTAYLQGELEEENYIQLPENLLTAENKPQVCKLKKAMYGLKQSGRAWNKKLSTVLKRMNLIQSKTDQCIYFKISNNKFLIVAVYVDDLLILSQDKMLLETTKQSLQENFQMKDLGIVRQYLGMRITRNSKNGTLYVDQSMYINEILHKYNMSDCKPVSTPADPNVKLTKAMQPKSQVEVEEMRNIPYQEVIGSLLFLSQGTRSDIALATAAVSCFNQNPGKTHWIAVKRILRYLKGTSNVVLEFSKQENSMIKAYSDADWANELDNRHSITGNVLKFQGGAISWSCKKQKTVALSTTEAEYMALSTTCQEVLWLRSLAAEIECEAINRPTHIYCDNKGAVDLAQTNGYRQRTKHIDVRHHFLREKIESDEIKVSHISTDINVADALTKPLFKQKFAFCFDNMGLKNICSSGGC